MVQVHDWKRLNDSTTCQLSSSNLTACTKCDVKYFSEIYNRSSSGGWWVCRRSASTAQLVRSNHTFTESDSLGTILFKAQTTVTCPSRKRCNINQSKHCPNTFNLRNKNTYSTYFSMRFWYWLKSCFIPSNSIVFPGWMWWRNTYKNHPKALAVPEFFSQLSHITVRALLNMIVNVVRIHIMTF